MFDSLTDKFQGIFGSLRRNRQLNEKDVRESLRAVRVALLEADVSLDVVKEFIASIREQAVGETVLASVRPGDQVIKIVQDALVELLGTSDSSIPYKSEGVTVILMAGLQGSGKTTTCAKLAAFLSARDYKKVLLVAADLQRPAAIEQLRTLGKQLNIPVYSEENSQPPLVCNNGLKKAKELGCDLVILDTAGRLHVDDALMREIRMISESTRPDQTFLVCDAMTGQDAVQSAAAFNKVLTLDGTILTKLDGDTRGGAALSLRHVTKKPVKFAGVGEQLDKFEEFHPDRMAGRILGMGDVVSLVEKAQEAMSEKEAMEMQEKLLKNRFTLEDFLKQLQMIKKMGSIKDLLGMIPGLGNAMKGVEVDDKQFSRIEAFIQSMTPTERKDPDLLNGPRRKRIATGSGQTVQEFNQFLNQYRGMQKMMSGLGKGGGMMSGMKNMMGLGKGSMGGMLDAMPDIDGLDGMQEAGLLGSPDKKTLKKLRKEKKAKRKQGRK